MAKLKIATQTTVTSGVNYVQPEGDRFVSPTLINGYHYGGVGGLSSDGGLQITAQVNLPGGSSSIGSIIAQKGAHKFRVTDGTRTGVCTLVNSPSPATGQMNILITLNSAAANIAAANVAGGATSTTVTYDTRTAVSGPVTLPRVGDYLSWTSPSANIGGYVRVTAITGSTFTIATTGNVAAATGVTLTTNTYASKITNKFVSDFTSDGHPDSTSGSATFLNNGGFNPNKYRYVLGSSAGPNATFVKVQSN
jgi:hypothetical protein